MVRPSRTKELILKVLSDGKPKSHRDFRKATDLGSSAVNNGLYRCWIGGLILRTKEPFYEAEKIFKGRGDMSANTRPYHLYVLKQGKSSITIDGREYVSFSEKHLDVARALPTEEKKIIGRT